MINQILICKGEMMLKNHYWKFVVAIMITALIAGVGLVPECYCDNLSILLQLEQHLIALVADYASPTRIWGLVEWVGLGGYTLLGMRLISMSSVSPRCLME
jgi:hypothetical protein